MAMANKRKPGKGAGSGADADADASASASASNDPNDIGGFTEQQLQYDLDEWLIHGRDDRGGSARVSCNVPPHIERELDVVLQGRRFPYRTISDIMRHAVVRHLAWLHELERDMPKHILNAMEAVVEVTRDTEMRTRLGDTFDSLDRQIERALSDGDVVEAMRVMTLAKAKVRAVPDTRWRKNWLEQFSRKYGSYLTPVVAAEATGTGGPVAGTGGPAAGTEGAARTAPRPGPNVVSFPDRD
jgi:hypothetical protein